jgi:hypothetical protein
MRRVLVLLLGAGIVVLGCSKVPEPEPKPNPQPRLAKPGVGGGKDKLEPGKVATTMPQ